MLSRHLSVCAPARLICAIPLAQENHGANPMERKVDFVMEAGSSMMRLLKGAYSCICLVMGVGLVAFRDPHGIRWGELYRGYPTLILFIMLVSRWTLSALPLAVWNDGCSSCKLLETCDLERCGSTLRNIRHLWA